MDSDSRPAAPGGLAIKVASIMFLVNGGIWWLFLFLAYTAGFVLFFAVGQLIAGIVGLKNANNPGRAKALRAVGSVMLIFSLMIALMLAIPEMSPVLTIHALALIAAPLVYMYGAWKNLKKQKKESDQL